MHTIGLVGKPCGKCSECIMWGSKLLSGIKSMYVGSSACVRVKRVESEWFMMDSGLRQEYIMSTWLFNIWMEG